MAARMTPASMCPSEMSSRTFLIFGRDEEFDDDANWWPLWSRETHVGASAKTVLVQIRQRLREGGEEQYVELAAVLVGEFHVEPFETNA